MARPFTAGLFAPVPLLAAIGLIVVVVLGGAVVGGVLDRPGPAPLPVPSAGPIATLSPSPSPRIIHVDLVEVAGQDASIDITDRSGALVDAETGQPADGGSVGGSGIELATDPVDPMVIVVTWTGTPCDTTHVLEIEADGRTMTLARPRCEGDATPRDLQLRLRFREAIDPSALAATLVTE